MGGWGACREAVVLVMLEAAAVCVLRRPRVACAGIAGRNPPSEATRPPAKKKKKLVLGGDICGLWVQTPALPLSSGGLGHVTGPFCTWFTFAKCIFSIILLMHINFPLRSVMVGE